MQNFVTTTTGTNYEVAGRIIEKLHDHADTFGVEITGQLERSLQNFFTDVIREERDESTHDKEYEGLTADVADRLGEALKRLAESVTNGTI